MQPPTLEQVEDALREFDLAQLRDMAFEMAEGHVGLCRVTSRLGECAHSETAEIRDRIGALDADALVDLLAPSARLAVLLQGTRD